MFRSLACIAGLVVLLGAVPAVADDAKGTRAVERGLAFLVEDARTWRRERSCATCHHGTMTVWALSEAKARGYSVADATIREMADWTKEQRFRDLDKPRDPRPGYKMVNTPALYLAVMARTEPVQEALTPDEVRRIAGHLLRHQEADGSWAWSLAPPANRFPPAFESDEVATLMGLVALDPNGLDSKGPAAEGRRKAEAWLATAPRTESTQSLAMRLLLAVQARQPESVVRAETDRLLARQHEDGGWGQLRGLCSDAYATGQALFVLNLAGVARDRPEIRRGVSFLVATQRPDGAWPMIPRGQPGVRPASLVTPITYFGSAWGTIGLARSVEK